MPPSGWMNDPNGLIQFKSKYHLFYQYNPYGVQPPYPPCSKTGAHWGHAISDDLLFWKDLPIALFPNKNKPDKDGCWSGSAVNNNGILTLIYTGVRPECICVAESKDGVKFEKSPLNPVIKSPPENFEVTGFRDPYVWKEKDLWYMIVGSGVKERGGIAFLYKSKNLLHWEYGGVFCEAGIEYGYMWECPNFFKVKDKYVLVVSSVPLGYPIYFIGKYKNNKFKIEKQGKVDLFPFSFYAPQIFKDDKDRVLMFGWLRELTKKEFHEEQGWAGVMSLPRILDVENNELKVNVIPEINKLRSSLLLDVSDIEITDEKTFCLKDMEQNSVEIDALINLIDTDFFKMVLLFSDLTDENINIGYDKNEKTFFVDTVNSSLYETHHKTLIKEKMDIENNEIFMQIFVDNSVIEIFLNNKFSFSLRVYPSKFTGLNLSFLVNNGKLKIKRLSLWEMKNIWLISNSERINSINKSFE